MADEVDLAPDYNASDLARHLASVSKRRLPLLVSDFCEECGRVIPEARRDVEPNCVLCVSCAAEFESKFW